MIKKLAYLGAIALLISSIVSCEKDFEDVSSNIIGNDVFETDTKTLDIQIDQEDISSVRADNVAIGTLGEYWLGVYNNSNYEKIEASIVSQVGYVNGLSSKETDGDTIFSLDKVVLKLPYQSVSLGKNSDKKNTFRLDSILGSGETSVKVYKNNTYLNRLNTINPQKEAVYMSDAKYVKDNTIGILNEDENFKFEPKVSDTIFVADVIKDNITIDKHTLTNTANKINIPFLAIPLNTAKMKALFWDKFNSADFASKNDFENYFRGLIIEAEGNNGSLVPLKLASGSTLEFLYSKIVVRNSTVDKVIKARHSFPLSGVKNSVYKMSNSSSTASNSVSIQGTAGKTAKINLFPGTQLQELRAKNWLINDASLTFYVNQTVDQNTATVPQRLFLYKNLSTNTGTIPVQISDAYTEAALYGGGLENDNKKPNKYTIRITDYISDVLKGNEPASPLTLKVYNPTDVAISNRSLDTIVKTYNWNPRGVTLLDNSSANGDKRAVLKISYTKKK